MSEIPKQNPAVHGGSIKELCRYRGGSYSYGLDLPSSDLDIRGIYLSTNISEILGLNKNEQQSQQNNERDEVFYELRHFLKLLKSGNTTCTEMLYIDDFINETIEFYVIQYNRDSLISSKTLFKCLLGYINREKHIILRTDSGKLGAKRKEQLEKFGYSFRNAVHALRLARSGIIFFRNGYYPVNIVKDDKEYGEFIRDVKINPQNHKVDDLIKLIEKFEMDLKREFDTRCGDYIFNYDLANQLCLEFYLPILDRS